MRRGTSITLLLGSVMLGMLSHIVTADRDYSIRLQLVVRGHSFATVCRPSASASALPALMVTDAVYEHGAIIGYVDSAGEVLLKGDAPGRDIDIVLLPVFVEVCCFLLATLSFCMLAAKLRRERARGFPVGGHGGSKTGT